MFAHLPDDERWRRRKATLTAGASVPADSVERAALFENYLAACVGAWHSAREADGQVTVEAEDGTATYDFAVIAGTGYQQNPATRTELSAIATHIALWRDRFTRRPGRSRKTLGVVLHLGPGYQLTEREPGQGAVAGEHPRVLDRFHASSWLPVGDVPAAHGIPRSWRRSSDPVIADLDRARTVAAR